MANTSASASRGNELLFAAVEMLFKVPPLFKMAVKQVSAHFCGAHECNMWPASQSDLATIGSAAWLPLTRNSQEVEC